MVAIQHQAPDTTSPSPPHTYATNGTAVTNTNGFPSTMLPQGKTFLLCLRMNEL